MKTKTRRKSRYTSFYFCLACAVLFTLFSVCAGYFAPYDPLKTDYGSLLAAPSAVHVCGTDQLGRDLFSRILYGGRTSLLIAYLVTGIVSVFGIFIGIISGQAGGIADEVIMRLVDVLIAFPGNIFTLAMVAVMGTGIQNLVIAMCFTGWTKYARASRSLVLSIKNENYIIQAKLGGASFFKVIWRYIMPNVVPSLLVLMAQDIGNKLLTVAGLSLLGLGSKPPTPEWGFMLSEGRNYMSEAPWLLLFPGVVILINVIIFNLLGDSLRDIMDPHF
ncbi:MAG: ABC transporter permease [Lachnospiraceae bacterium]|nr:ABC transporter permease [Lachnospiraceae bacterium]